MASVSAPTMYLDEETGEMVTKNELAKRKKKREKKAAQAATRATAPQTPATAPSSKTIGPAQAPTVKDAMSSMFSVGFLKKVRSDINTEAVLTRFPPEPNGYLHIGHAKAIFVNFGFARFHGGNCLLRYDDTNPEAEEEVFFTAILEMVRWLGFEPHKITYSSDYFDQLYELAEKLVTEKLAYMCYCTDVDIKLQRGGEKNGPRFRCKHADQSVEYNLEEFRAMRDGKYKPKEAFLRMKQDVTDGNPQMWDLAAYRVLNQDHYRTGDKWKIYPTYDFTHCIVDSLEGITHSLCTTEFLQSRVSYEWLNNVALKLPHKSTQREYGRLNITGTLLSKRKIAKLVHGGYVRGWDDPRLYTLIAIRRRGVPPVAILEFVKELGVSTGEINIQLARFDQTIRKYLELTVPRLMLVLDPVRVIIEDAEEMDLEIPFSPKIPAFGSHKLKLTKTVYIDRTDFREVDSEDYYRLAPGKSVGLLSIPFPVKATSFTKEGELVTEIKAVYDKTGKKPKTYIQWAPEDSLKAEVRIHNALFKHEKPDDVEGGFLKDINPESETIWPNALIEPGLDEVRKRAPWPEAEGTGESSLGQGGLESVRFQGVRIAYFCLDRNDTVGDKVVINRIVSLKEDSGKSV